MGEATKTVFVTKWALTGGIAERGVVKLDADGYAWVDGPGAPVYGNMIGKKDWHTTREAAVARAEQMRDAKIKSLDQQRERLSEMRF